MARWSEYFKRCGSEPNSFVVRVLEQYVRVRAAALDLGAGNLRDSKYLLGEGFSRVVAVDGAEETLAFPGDGIERHIQPIESYKIEINTFDFVISCHTLYFLRPADVAQVFENVLAGLRPGAVFACNLLGIEDEWAGKDKDVTPFHEHEIVQLCSGFEVLARSSHHHYQPSPATVNYVPPMHSHFWCLVLAKA